LRHVQILLRFLRFGVMAWGGPVAQIGMLRRELVDDEGWISSHRFNRLLAVYQVLPGPEAHELCVHLGMLRGGRLGGLAAGLGFMLPGFVLMLALSWLYTRIDLTASALGGAFLGVQVAVIALIVRAIERIGRHVLIDRWLWAIGCAAALASLLSVSFWVTLPTAGLVYTLCRRRRYVAAGAVAAAAAGIVMYSVGVGVPVALTVASGSELMLAAEASPIALFLSGLKAGLLTFGGAYTVIPFLRDDAVGQGWLSDSRFLDGLALSGILPAPLIIFSTFVGFIAGGVIGAVAMTVGIFLPAFAFSLLFYDRLESVIENRELHSFLEGVAAGVIGLIVATTLHLAAAASMRLPALAPGIAIFAASLVVLVAWRAKASTPVVIVGSGLVGWLAFGSGVLR
jgi:chromate transporter